MRSSIIEEEQENFYMNTQPDFEGFLRLLEEFHVDYMIIGGYAVGFHGYPRFTKGIDIFYYATPENVERLRKTLVAFGFRHEDTPETTFVQNGNVVTFGVAPVRIDLINTIDGVTFAEARAATVRGSYGAVAVTFIGLHELLKNKRTTQRAKDQADVEELS